RALKRLIGASDATIMQATPTLWQTLSAEATAGELAGLTMLAGGEALGGELAAALRQQGRGLTHLYGPTETTIWSAAMAVTADGTPPIGRPIWNTRVYVLDGGLEPVAAGVVGVLFLPGGGGARGYLARVRLDGGAVC